MDVNLVATVTQGSDVNTFLFRQVEVTKQTGSI